MTQPTCLFVATPCYGGQLLEAYFASILGLQQLAFQRNLPLKVITLTNESLITRARNRLVYHFLEDPDATHLLFIDADIGFDPELPFTLLDYDKPVTCAIYPRKQLDWEAIHRAAREGKPAERLESCGLGFNLSLPKAGQFPIDRGFIETPEGATGFMLIQREVFTTMKAAYPDLRYNPSEHGGDDSWRTGNHCLFFDTMVDPETGRYLSEDYAFCKRWLATGGRIHAEVTSTLVHHGTYPFKGSVVGKYGI